MKRSKAYIIRNEEEFLAVDKIIGDYYHVKDFFDKPDKPSLELPLIIYVKSRVSGDVPGWDYYANVEDSPVLNDYDVVESSVLLRKQKLIKIGL